MQPQRIDEMVELLGQATDRPLAAFDVFVLTARRGLLPEPRKSPENELQRLPQVMSSHREQHRIELARPLEVGFTARPRAPLLRFDHDTTLPHEPPRDLLRPSSSSFSRVGALTAVRFRELHVLEVRGAIAITNDVSPGPRANSAASGTLTIPRIISEIRFSSP